MGTSDHGVTFGAVLVPVCQDESIGYDLVVTESLLMSGKMNVQGSTYYHHSPSFQCMGVATQITDLLAKIGTASTFVLNGTSYENYYIKSIGPAQKIMFTNYYKFGISFSQEHT